MSRSLTDDRSRDAGMTLIELVVVVVLIGVLTGAVAGAIMVVFRSQNGVVATTAESHDTQQIVSYLPLDVQSGPSRADAYRAVTGGAGGDRGTGCIDDAGDANLLRIDVTDRRLDVEERRIAYQLSDGAEGRRIDRHVCRWDAAALAWVVETSTNVVDRLDPDVPLEAAATSEVIVATDLASPADEEVVAVQLSYVQRGQTETVRAAPREEQPLATSGVCGADPLAAARDIDSFVEGDVHLVGTAVKSRLFVGGVLSFEGSVDVAQTGGLPPVILPGPYTDLGLLAGSVNWAGSTGTITVKQGADVLLEGGAYASDADGPISDPFASSPATIALQGGAVLAPGADRLIAPGSAFLELRSCSDRLAELPDSCNNAGCASHVGLPADYSGTDSEAPTLSLEADRINVLNLDIDNLLDLQTLQLDFAPGDNIGESTPLVINVASVPGAPVAFEAPRVQGSGTNTVYLVWNFPNASAVTLLADEELRGTLMAPYAEVVARADIDGGVIAQKFTMYGGSLSTHRSFAGVLEW